MFTSRFEDALVYAAQLHATQVRKQTDIPYISHLLAVTSLVIENGGGEDEAIAALLHDAVEDQGGAQTRAEIARRFGERVAEMVSQLSDTDATPKPPWRARKEAYLAHLPHAPEAVRLISAADKLHNARTILADYRQNGEPIWRRFRGGKDGTLWYYRSLVEIFTGCGPSPLAAELARTVTELERLVANA